MPTAQISYSEILTDNSQVNTPKRTVRRQLPAMPPTPTMEDATLSRMLLDQNDIQICNAPSGKTTSSHTNTISKKQRN